MSIGGIFSLLWNHVVSDLRAFTNLRTANSHEPMYITRPGTNTVSVDPLGGICFRLRCRLFEITKSSQEGSVTAPETTQMHAKEQAVLFLRVARDLPLKNLMRMSEKCSLRALRGFKEARTCLITVKICEPMKEATVSTGFETLASGETASCGKRPAGQPKSSEGVGGFNNLDRLY